MGHKLLLVSVFYFVLKYGEAIQCHRCFSSMGGCGADGVVWRMFPWRDCGDSDFCVKVVTKKDGEEKIIRECENNLMKSPFHRMRMPVLRRHGYCEPARKNDFWNPTETTDPDTKYCFCNDWNGCNGATSVSKNTLTMLSVCLSVLTLAWKALL